MSDMTINAPNMISFIGVGLLNVSNLNCIKGGAI